MAGWYDACTGWAATVDRLAVFSFSVPFIKTTRSFFFVSKNSTASFDWRDITGKKIGFLHGWASNDKCVARWTAVSGSVLREEQKFTVASPAQLRDSILSGTVDAGFAGQRDMEAEMTYLDQVGDGTSCFVVGQAMVTRKDSDFNSYWNVGFQKLVSSGKFKKLCEETEKKHGHKGDIGCVET
ncbi:uncharacterized protein LOC106162141 isoform X2 [Lingula anatina]|nr:uncharacterized protein LOC106162141 isoform X2 [Lingula anatina]|eukprot:XP_013394755.1 uncharacterized protein LOC106162141 isoform X2 [Lingula anatina]